MKLRVEISNREKEILGIIKLPLTLTIWFLTWALVAFLNVNPTVSTWKSPLAYMLGTGFLIVGVASMFVVIFCLDLINVRLYTTWKKRHGKLRYEDRKRRKWFESRKDKKWGTQL